MFFDNGLSVVQDNFSSLQDNIHESNETIRDNLYRSNQAVYNNLIKMSSARRTQVSRHFVSGQLEHETEELKEQNVIVSKDQLDDEELQLSTNPYTKDDIKNLEREAKVKGVGKSESARTCRFNLASALVCSDKNFDRRKGLRMFDDLRKEDPDRREYLYYTARALYGLKDHSAALDMCDLLLSHEPTNRQALVLKTLAKTKLRRQYLVYLDKSDLALVAVRRLLRLTKPYDVVFVVVILEEITVEEQTDAAELLQSAGEMCRASKVSHYCIVENGGYIDVLESLVAEENINTLVTPQSSPSTGGFFQRLMSGTPSENIQHTLGCNVLIVKERRTQQEILA